VEVHREHDDFVQKQSMIYDNLSSKQILDDGIMILLIDTAFDYLGKDGQVKLDYANLQSSLSEQVSLLACTYSSIITSSLISTLVLQVH
jgi:hypothetical protein